MSTLQLVEDEKNTPRPDDNLTDRGTWLSVVSHLDPRYGGMSAMVPQLASSVMESSALKVRIAAFCAPDERYRPKNDSDLEIRYWPAGRAAWMRERMLRGAFRQEIAGADGIHIHGLWEQSTAVAAGVARDLAKPYVLSPHGMLEPWALRSKRLKKLVYSTFVERANVQGAACAHALTRNEAMQCREFGYKGPIAVIPNGIEVPSFLESKCFLMEHESLVGRRIFLFLGRLHPKKGLDLLVEGWAASARQWPESVLVIAGPDAEGMRGALEEAVRRHGVEDQVYFTGMLAMEMKWSALAAAECFLLTSYSEGLSMSVLEAMGAGVPVIVTDACNMPEVAEFDAGWVVRPEMGELVTALADALSNPRSMNAAMGDIGRRLVRARYHREAVARKMADLYLWVQGGPVPGNIEILHG